MTDKFTQINVPSSYKKVVCAIDFMHHVSLVSAYGHDGMHRNFAICIDCGTIEDVTGTLLSLDKTFYNLMVTS